MKETARLRTMAARATRLAGGIGDRATIIILQAYALECSLDADCRQADLDNAAWVKPAV